MSKFLIIRFSSIGDIVLTTPVMRCIKKDNKNHEIHYLTKSNFASLLVSNPYLNKVHTIEKKVSEIADILQAENFDFVIDLHNNLRSAKVKLLLKKKSFTFKKLNFKKWILVNTKIDLLPNKHIVTRYLETLQPLNIVDDGLGLDFYIEPQTVLPNTILELENYIAFVIGGTHKTKKLTDDKIISICKKIDKPILLLGGKEETENGKNICDNSSSNVHDFCGKLSLQQSALVVKNASIVITHDTGLMHIAAAFGKKIISVWGNTVPEFGMYPYLVDKNKIENNIIVEVENLSCRPCSKIGYKQCPKKHFNCINLIDENEIVNNI